MKVKLLEFIICDKYINKELEKKHNSEYYLLKFSPKTLNIFSDKTYRFEYYTSKIYNIRFDFLLDMISYRLENLSDINTKINRLDRSILIEYNENNTFLIIKIVDEVLKQYIKNILHDNINYNIDLDKLISSNYKTEGENRISISDNSSELMSIDIDELKNDLYKCYDIETIGYVCGKIIFDNVFNNSRSLKNKIDQFYYEEYLTNVVKQEKLKDRFYKTTKRQKTNSH